MQTNLNKKIVVLNNLNADSKRKEEEKKRERKKRKNV